ncbi:MAG TPA: alkaline phosphatase family protein [Candidatus Acidoferrum sp.]|nr:alkaline phosphatase family protein [Candidatus Acidoferrum sp.]
MADNVMDQIKHLVVVMMENRSFDHLLGFLYAREKNTLPLRLLGRRDPTLPEYDGLSEANPTSDFWNPSNADYFTGKEPVKVFATQGTKGPNPFLAPDHDPHEEFANITYQIMGPPGWTGEKMRGFLVDYQTTDPRHPQNANQLMECYSPEQLSVISQLARNYAVSDRWFCSTPNQTLPNRAFVHAGTSMGRVNNEPEPLYDAETIFEVLADTGHSWRVYNDTMLMSLARLQFPQLWNGLLQLHFRGMGEFEEDAAAGTLPDYSFLEPSFQIAPNDGHPPHDMCLGEQFLLRIWKTVSSGKNWNGTLLLITFDEHGGCYDHVEPPPAEPPGDAIYPGDPSKPEEGEFHFNRYGVRVPALLISPYIEPGTVFRSPTDVPYDHTSILATIRDWLHIPPEKMLTSKRILKAPTFANVLTRATPREDVPTIKTACVPQRAGIPLPIGLNDLQKVMITAHRKRYVHGLVRNWPRLKGFGTPPPRAKRR